MSPGRSQVARGERGEMRRVSRARASPKSPQLDSPSPLRRPTCLPSRARSSGRADPSASRKPFPRGTGRGSEPSNRHSIVLSGFHLASKRSCKQTARPTSATRFRFAYRRRECHGKNVDLRQIDIPWDTGHANSRLRFAEF